MQRAQPNRQPSTSNTQGRARRVPAGDLGVGEEPLVVPRGELAPVRDDVEAVVGPVRRREPVAAPHDDPQAELAGQARRRLQLVHEGVPIDAVPVLDLGLGAAGHRRFGEMHDRRALRPGLLHQRRISRPFSRTSAEIRLWATAILMGGLLMVLGEVGGGIELPRRDRQFRPAAHSRTTRAISAKTSSSLVRDFLRTL